ncbi:PaaI family thioesterase [Novosphingobium sp. ZN18A2]|uniref:PaaI family thioesterase n=1 Tax=Novosphingobium sp. ZN18A2 TaxID=3079861 RepID=UPI0030D47644
MNELTATQGAHAELMGVRFVSFDSETETVTMAFTAPDCFITPRGAVQGGLVAGFLDEAMGWAHVMATGGVEAPLNLDITMTLLKMVPAGPLTCTGRVLRRGKRVIFLEGELFDAEGNVLARSTSTAIPTPRPGT